MHNKKKWIDQCKALPVHGRQRVYCCGNDRSRIIEHLPDRYVSNCFRATCANYVEKKTGMARLSAERCKEACEELQQYKEPPDTTRDPMEFPEDAIVWLTQAGLHQDVWAKYDLGYSKKWHRVVIPIWMNGKKVGATMRALAEGDIKYLMKTDVHGAMYTCQKLPEHRSVILTEDILSAIRIKEALGKRPLFDVVCILGTGVMMDRAMFIVCNYKRAHLWLDGDEAGVVASKKWKAKLSPFIDVTSTNIWDNDPKDFTDAEIRELLKGV